MLHANQQKVSLQQAAGVEAHFSAFVRQARSCEPRFTHGWLNAAGGCCELSMRSTVESTLSSSETAACHPRSDLDAR